MNNSFIEELNNRVQKMPWPVIMPTDFKELLNTNHNMAIIDVREADSCCFSNDNISDEHIYNIPFNSIVQEFSKYDFSSYESIILICFAGPKGAVAASILNWMGINNAYFLKGGIEELSNL